MSLMLSTKCCEFFIKDDVCPAKGEMRDVMCFARWYVGEPVQDTICHRGAWGLCIFGNLYSFGGLLAVGFSMLP